MKMKFLIILFLFFLPVTSLKAQVCTCYNAAGVCQTDKTTTGAGIDDPPDSVSCDDYCTSQLRDDFSYYKFSDYGGEDIPNEVSTQISCETNAEAAAAGAAPSTQTAPTVKREYVAPVLSVNIPTVSFSKIFEDNGYIEVNWLSEYITGLYKYLLTISGIFAVFLLMVGGLQYVVSPGGSGQASAKKRMTNALTGMVLLFCVYMILYIVNPKLTVFEGLSIQTIDPVLYIQNSGDSNEALAGSITPPSGVQCTGSGDVAAVAKSFIGKVNYRYGGKGGLPPYDADTKTCDGKPCKDFCPEGTICLDCSGFVSYASKCAGLPAVSGGTSTIFATAPKISSCTDTTAVTSNGTVTLSPGDLVGFKSGDYAESPSFGHIFMYIGNGEVIDSSGSGRTGNRAVSTHKLTWACSKYPLRLVDR
ncbi:MAG: NlpC/P60 family protein [Patescibacteria group bacterium]|jgi:hypothetical protein